MGWVQWGFVSGKIQVGVLFQDISEGMSKWGWVQWGLVSGKIQVGVSFQDIPEGMSNW